LPAHLNSHLTRLKHFILINLWLNFAFRNTVRQRKTQMHFMHTSGIKYESPSIYTSHFINFLGLCCCIVATYTVNKCAVFNKFEWIIIIGSDIITCQFSLITNIFAEQPWLTWFRLIRHKHHFWTNLTRKIPCLHAIHPKWWLVVNHVLLSSGLIIICIWAQYIKWRTGWKFFRYPEISSTANISRWKDIIIHHPEWSCTTICIKL
jgi:hypothetical protein